MVLSLGNGDNQAVVFSNREGTGSRINLPATAIEWNRSLSAISRATINIQPDDCDPSLAQVMPWAHTLAIYRTVGREPERVWEGPIRRIADDSTGLTLSASDVLGWTERRPIRNPRSVVDSPVVTEMNDTITAAYATDDPAVLTYRQTIGGTGTPISRDVAAWSNYHAADLGTLVGSGGRYTVLGRRILTWAEATTIRTTNTLVPEKHLTVNVTVTLDGDELTTEAVARDDSGHAASDAGGGPLVDPFFGHVGVVASMGGDQAQDSLAAFAASMRAQNYPLPYRVEAPSGAALACDAPFPMEHLVPGVLVPLETTTATGRRVSGTFVLSSVKVTQAEGNDEKVSITLVPLTEAAA